MVRQLRFVKANNELLRARLPERVVVTPGERRRLIRLGKPLGSTPDVNKSASPIR
jgi:hypothetical protein